MSRQIILKHKEILLIIERLAVQVAESNLNSSNLVLIGLNKRGYFISEMVLEFLKKYLPNIQLDLQNISINTEGEINSSSENLNESHAVVIIDDVLNSGKTAFIAADYCFKKGVNKIETLFLAQREYRNFPIHANFVGVSIATTLRDHVYFDNTQYSDLQVYLS
jgi:pyrimidine operon attenuation protein/uracil phosphoribosyltransferase